jgi:hypothetical protein
MASIGLHVEGDLMTVADAVAAIAEVDFVVITSGSFDILVEVVCHDDRHLLALLNDQIRSIPGVHSTETFIHLRLHKQTYPWPPGPSTDPDEVNKPFEMNLAVFDILHAIHRPRKVGGRLAQPDP